MDEELNENPDEDDFPKDIDSLDLDED